MKDDDTSGGIIIALIALLIVSPVVSTCEISRSLDRMDKSIEKIANNSGDLSGIRYELDSIESELRQIKYNNDFYNDIKKINIKEVEE